MLYRPFDEHLRASGIGIASTRFKILDDKWPCRRAKSTGNCDRTRMGERARCLPGDQTGLARSLGALSGGSRKTTLADAD